MAVRADVSNALRRWLGTGDREGWVDAVSGQQVAHILAEGICRQAPEKLGWGPQASQRVRRVERPAPRRLALLAVSGRVVDHCSAAEDDQCPTSPVPRAIKRVGILRSTVGDRSLST